MNNARQTIYLYLRSALLLVLFILCFQSACYAIVEDSDRSDLIAKPPPNFLNKSRYNSIKLSFYSFVNDDEQRDYLDSISTPIVNYTRIRIVGVHTLWLKVLRRQFRSFAASDYQAYLDSKAHPVYGLRDYDEMIGYYQSQDSITNIDYLYTYGLVKDRTYVLGNTEPIAEFGPFTLTPRLRVRVDSVRLQEWLFKKDYIRKYVPSLILPGVPAKARRRLFTRMRFRVAVSADTSGVRVIGFKIQTGLILSRKYNTIMPINFSARYNIREQEYVVLLRLFNINY